MDDVSLLPSSVKRVVALDTNAYRSIASHGDVELASAEAARLVHQERRRGIQALASPTVLFELIAHLGSTTDPSYRVTKAALVAAVAHVTMSEGEVSEPAIFPSPDLQICHTFWREWPDELLRIDNTIRGIAKAVAEDPSDSALDRFRGDLRNAADLARAAETAFATGMKQHLVANLQEAAREEGKDPTRKEMLSAYRHFLASGRAAEFVAEAHVRRASAHLATPPSEAEIRQATAAVVRFFAVAVGLYVRIVKKIAESNWDLTTGKGGNHLWDLQVAFLIGEGHQVQGRPALLVSSDSEILAAATEAGVRNAVMPYSEYRNALDQGLARVESE